MMYVQPPVSTLNQFTSTLPQNHFTAVY